MGGVDSFVSSLMSSFFITVAVVVLVEDGDSISCNNASVSDIHAWIVSSSRG